MSRASDRLDKALEGVTRRYISLRDDLSSEQERRRSLSRKVDDLILEVSRLNLKIKTLEAPADCPSSKIHPSLLWHVDLDAAHKVIRKLDCDLMEANDEIKRLKFAQEMEEQRLLWEVAARIRQVF